MTDTATGRDSLPADPAGPHADLATGQIQKIIKTTDLQRYGIRVSDYLLA